MALTAHRKISSPRATPPTPPTRLAALIALALLAVPLTLRIAAPRALSTLRAAAPSPAGPTAASYSRRKAPFALAFQAHPADVCHVIAANPAASKLWQFNSRALCLSSSVCFRSASPFEAYLHAADLSATTCQIDSPGLVPSGTGQDIVGADFGTCAALQRKLVLCAHGDGLLKNDPECPELGSLDEVALSDQDLTRWFEDVSVVVPAYPYPSNIYHYGNVISWVAYVVDALPRLLLQWGLRNVHAAGGVTPYFLTVDGRLRKINIIFRGPKSRHGWQRDLLDLMVRHRLAANGVNVTLHYLASDNSVRHVCMRNAVVLGRRGHVNVWPFPNGTSVPLDGMSVPADAVEFKRAVYSAYNIDVRLPSRGNRGAVSELPPLTLGYARRLGGKEAAGGNVHLTGTIRRFNDEDEAWFTGLLRNETAAAGVRLHIFTTSSQESLQEQVANIVRVGFVVGIHGANLVNSIFMHPFGALLEIFPAEAHSPCYIAGSNSGLAYFKHMSSEKATPEESGCGPDHVTCYSKPRQRMVKIRTKTDRDGIRTLVRNGIRHLRFLYETYPGGIPVRYNEWTGNYDIRVLK